MPFVKNPLRVNCSEAQFSFRRAVILATVCLVVGLTGFVQGTSASGPGPTGEADTSIRTAEFHGDPLSFEDRVRYQRRIEEVYWLHRIWPAENPGPKPALAGVLPDEMLRERVATHLQKSSALEVFWQRPLTGEQLQAEVDRMARNTRNADLLRELFAALDNDPLLVAECLARPVLVDRLTRDLYARDKRFHRAQREQAQAALTTRSNEATRMPELGGEYVETEWRLAVENSEAANLTAEREASTVIDLSAEEWRERIERIAASFGIEHDPEQNDAHTALFDRIPLFDLSRLTEENDRFVVTSVLSKEPGRLRTATVAWAKQSFDAWWAEDGRLSVATMPSAGPGAVLPPPGGYDLPSTRGRGCAADTWTGLYYVPTGRHSHTAVWTGTEMIVWGGYDNTYLDTGGRYDPATDSWTATSTAAGVPAGRAYHTAVWTGTEMLVWGGAYTEGSYVYLDTGGRYDPLTDSWVATSSVAGVPAGRTGHTAVWAGSEMIVWGGYDGSQRVNSGGRYDPATDSWMATSTGTGAPAARTDHTAVWTGTEMIVWGGFNASFDVVQSGGRYDPAADNWTATSVGTGVPAVRRNHTAVWTGTEMIVWGGEFFDGGYTDLDTGGRYDPSTDSWTATSTGPGTPTERHDHTAVWTGTEMIVWGGDGGVSLNTGGRYDPAFDSWTATSVGSGVPAARANHTAVWTGTEMIVWGARVYSAFESTGGRYDPATDSWTATSTGAGVPTARESHTATWTGTEMIVWGGADPFRQNTGGRYDPAIDSWSPTSTGIGVPAGREAHTAVWTGTEMIVWGGGDGPQFNTGGRYNPATDSWTATSTGIDLPAERIYHTAVWTGTEMIVWGGSKTAITGGLVQLDTGGRYDPVANSWTVTSTGTAMPSERERHAAVWTGTEMIVWGGRYDSDFGYIYFDTGARYDSATDSWTATSTGAGVPVGRDRHTAVWTGSEMIVWGGSNGALPITGGRYSPQTDSWNPTSTGSGVPIGRTWHTAVWTGAEMVVWGGLNVDGGQINYLNAGGRYAPLIDGWTATSTGPGVPPGRTYHTAVWSGTAMIVWGGLSSNQLNGGGLYCACDEDMESTWYLDADEDGHGDDSTSVSSCVQPPGYVATGGDCDDTDASTHPGAQEVNDGLDNQCPGDIGHGLVDEISGVCGFFDVANRDEFSCPAQTGATSYELARSPHPAFPSWVGCLRVISPATSWVDSDPVPEGDCFYYLVRSHEPNSGSWGADSGGVERTATCHR